MSEYTPLCLRTPDKRQPGETSPPDGQETDRRRKMTGGRMPPLLGRPLRVAVATVALLMGCAAGSGESGAPPPGEQVGEQQEQEEGEEQGEREPLTVTGALTEEGVECQALRGDDGDLYTLTGDLEGFGPGDRVRVVGRPARFSFCMQGTTLEVESVERLSSGASAGHRR